ncbi:MAG: hypothetical protein MI923_05760 [Phycisphaerales bacterium]|nr:hypothetical protein [Phycisphaerales bacterium]
MRGVGRKWKRSYSCQSDYVELKTPLTIPPIFDLHHEGKRGLSVENMQVSQQNNTNEKRGKPNGSPHK